MPVNFHLLIFPVWLPVEHAACQHGVAWPGSPLRAQDGPQGLRAVESMSTESRDKQLVVYALTGPPVAHYLRGDATWSRQRTASSKFLIRKVVLLCEKVWRQEGKQERLPLELSRQHRQGIVSASACVRQ